MNKVEGWSHYTGNLLRLEWHSIRLELDCFACGGWDSIPTPDRVRLARSANVYILNSVLGIMLRSLGRNKIKNGL
jgi:hypothetical protein